MRVNVENKTRKSRKKIDKAKFKSVYVCVCVSCLKNTANGSFGILSKADF